MKFIKLWILLTIVCVLFSISLLASFSNLLIRKPHLDKNNNNVKTTINSYKLSHVIIPFHIKQIDQVIANIDKWSKYKPCLKIDRSNRNHMPKLLFYIGYSNNQTDLNDIKLKMRNLMANFECFSNGNRIDLMEVKINPEQDTHLLGSALMFENMLTKRHRLLTNASYIFYMEPDTKPVRSDWLNAIEREIGFNDFWIRGCAYLPGFDIKSINDTKGLKYVYHMNGNAIYNIGDGEFIRFYFESVKPFVNSLFDNYPFDLYLITYLLDERNWKTSMRVLHKFLYTQVIINTDGVFGFDSTMNDLHKLFPVAYFSHRYVPVDY